MAAQNGHQGDDERGGGTLADGRQTDVETDARVAELEAELDRKDEQLRALIEQYEHVLATRDRLRREADGEFVWTDDRTILDRLR
jgi:hypothetical protein